MGQGSFLKKMSQPLKCIDINKPGVITPVEVQLGECKPGVITPVEVQLGERLVKD